MKKNLTKVETCLLHLHYTYAILLQHILAFQTEEGKHSFLHCSLINKMGGKLIQISKVNHKSVRLGLFLC